MRQALIRALSDLEDDLPYVTLEDIYLRLATPASALERSELATLLEDAVRGGWVFTDARTRFDRPSRTFLPVAIYRVNHRHPLVRELV